MALSDLEHRLCAALAGSEQRLVGLATELIGFDTTAGATPGTPAREEAAVQRLLAGRLEHAGAAVDLWEPDDAELAGHPWFPPGHTMAGRPQLCARFSGASGGRSLMLNGHVDVVTAEPIGSWTSDPMRARLQDGHLYGRGACDMKGQIAAIVVAAEAIAHSGARLAGDLLVVTNTDEESTGAGALAVVERGIRADAGITAEATGWDAWVACRGVEFLTVTVHGRSGHVEAPPAPGAPGTTVNAIDGARALLDALEALGRAWADDPEAGHPLLGPGRIVPTAVRGGEWLVSVPGACTVEAAVLYPPAAADVSGGGSAVRTEVGRHLAVAAAADPHAAGCTIETEWSPLPARPMEIAPEDDIAAAALGAARDLGRPGRAGAGAWHDGATYTRLGGFPVIAFGPPGLGDCAGSAHGIDEHVAVADLVRCAQALAVIAVRFCGAAG